MKKTLIVAVVASLCAGDAVAEVSRLVSPLSTWEDKSSNTISVSEICAEGRFTVNGWEVVDETSANDVGLKTQLDSGKKKKFLKKVAAVALVGGSVTLMSIAFAPTFWSPVMCLGLKGIGVGTLKSIFWAGAITGTAAKYSGICYTAGTGGISLGGKWFIDD